MDVSWQDALACVVAAIAVIVSIVSAPNAVGVLGAGLALVTITIAVIDWRHFVIPDWLNMFGLCLAFAHAAVRDSEAMVSSVTAAAIRGGALALVFLALRSGYARFRGRQGLGLGDVKLAAVAGAWLDWLMIPIALQLAVLAALSTYVLRQIVVSRRISATGRLPFGFFLAPAIWLCWVFDLRWFRAF
jgi:leader peptidase (prepilin peptidase)/N-methyltransferase